MDTGKRRHRRGGQLQLPGRTDGDGPSLEARPPGTYTFTDTDPVPVDQKVGLGGSAAATVAAVVAGLRARGATPSREEVGALAREVHHAVQGSGSGLDVAASTWGGVIRFEAGAVTPMGDLPPLSVVFTGASARTGPRVQRYLEWDERAPFVARMRALVDGFPSDPIAALRAGQRLLKDMSFRAHVPYWTNALGALVDLAEAEGGACKPSGAGGGDIVVALFSDEAARARFEAAARSEGFQPIDVRIGSPP